LSALGRRRLLLGLSSLALACGTRGATNRAPATNDVERRLAELEARTGGRLGVFAIDGATGRTVAHRPDERFAMCSTFKWLLAAAVLERADHAKLDLAEPVRFGESDLLEYAPVTRTHVAKGALSVGELVDAAVVVSDNTAANLLLDRIGGPSALTRFARSLGDEVTRLDRKEPELNANMPGDPRDTTSPRAMALDMQKVMTAGVLSPRSRERLAGSLVACETGRERLRAGLPAAWRAGDKTGTCNRSAVNDIAIAWPRGAAPLVIACFTSDSEAGLATLSRLHVEVARLVSSAA